MADAVVEWILKSSNNTSNGDSPKEQIIKPRLACSRFEIGYALHTILEEDAEEKQLSYRQRLACLIALRAICRGIESGIETFNDFLQNYNPDQKIDEATMTNSPFLIPLIEQILVQLKNLRSSNGDKEEETKHLMNLLSSVLPYLGDSALKEILSPQKDTTSSWILHPIKPYVLTNKLPDEFEKEEAKSQSLYPCHSIMPEFYRPLPPPLLPNFTSE